MKQCLFPALLLGLAAPVLAQTLTFGPAVAYGSGSTGTSAVADLNGDDKPDIITANSTTSKVSVLLNTSVLATQSAQLAAGVRRYPNPAIGSSFAVQVRPVAGGSQVQVELRTALGQGVRQLRAPLPAGGTQLTFSTAGLAAGWYLLCLQAGDQTLVRRVVVE